MKKIIPVFALILIGWLCSCHSIADNKHSTQLLQGSRCFLLTANEQLWPEGDTLGVDNRYSLLWPADDLLSPANEREMILRVFGDSTSTTFQQAADKWLNNSWIYEEETDLYTLHKYPIDSLPAGLQYNYAKIEGHVVTDSNLLTFVFSQESYEVFAAHGLYASRYITVDMDTRHILHLSDLLQDTTRLGEVIARAVQDLVVNKPTLDNLFEEYQRADALPIPVDFYIDSTRSAINFVYQLYEISPYCNGIQTVVLPIFWLSKHIPLTSYAKAIFGPEAYLQDN